MRIAPRIALIHATPLSLAPIHDAFAEGWPEPTLADLLDSSLSADLARDGTLTPAMTARFVALSDYVVGAGADAILFTCSAFGPCIEAVAARHARLPVLKPNEAMIADAVKVGGRIGLVASFAPSFQSMLPEFAAAAPGMKVEAALAEGAMQALAAGDAARHDRLVADAAATLRHCDVIAFAQFSLSRAKPAAEAASGRPVLTTPGAAVTTLRKRLGG